MPAFSSSKWAKMALMRPANVADRVFSAVMSVPQSSVPVAACVLVWVEPFFFVRIL
jgi:hypothetical protein